MAKNERQPSKREIVQAFREAFQAEPVGRLYADLVIAYATNRGGDILRFWQTFEGVLWTSEEVEPTNLTLEQAAGVLNMPISKAERIWRETWDAIRPKLEASSDWQRLQKSRRPDGP